jgi:hypothetical protein
VCTSKAIYGTDAANPPGNEKGYIVNFTRCIDSDNLHNALRVNKGDELTVTALYDVDVNGTHTAPLPGGKHGGIMGLFFFMIDCDEDALIADYVCRQDTCIPVPANRTKGAYKSKGACEAACGA